MLDGFTERRIDSGEVTLTVQTGGEGPPLVLLHGYPQNHMCWAKVAPAFARHFAVIVPDLRGYGTSDAPPDDADHTEYSKRTIARDIVGLARALGHDRFSLLGHDRGARVSYRLALDHPEVLTRLGIVEIVPTADFWDAWNAELAMKAYHWTFLAQPRPLPETLISADPEGYILHTLKSWTRAKSLDCFPEASLAAYLAQARDPDRIAAMCADYRAGATTDRAHDLADRAAGRKIGVPMMFLCGEDGFPAKTGDPAKAWSGWAEDLTVATAVCGHFAMEEAPDDVVAAFLPFFLGGA